jgi:hypothetical protein
MPTSKAPELAELLNDLLDVQGQFLKLLGRKRDLLLANDGEGLAGLVPDEERLVGELQTCVRRREALLEQAAHEGVKCRDLQGLARALPRGERTRLEPHFRQATAQARLLRHQSLVNWVVVQRTLLHLSQLLEIIATGGRLQPTYGRGEPVASTGGLVDQAG